MSNHEYQSRTSPSLRRRRLGVTLRRYRESALVSREVAGQTLDCSESKISRIENGDVRVNQRDLYSLLDLYGIEDQEVRAELRLLARQGGERGGWWVKYNNEIAGSFRRFVELESVATSIKRVAVTAVPGILQTADYARAINRATAVDMTADEIERKVEIRIQRQQLLDRADPPENLVILDEATLHRMVGGRDVMLGQLRRLREVSGMPAVRLQVLPFSVGAHQAMPGAFAIMRFPDPDPDVVYSEGFAGEVTFDDANDVATASLVFDRLAAEALDPESSAAFLDRVIARF